MFGGDIMLYQISILFYILIICSGLLNTIETCLAERLKARGQFAGIYRESSHLFVGMSDINIQIGERP